MVNTITHAHQETVSQGTSCVTDRMTVETTQTQSNVMGRWTVGTSRMSFCAVSKTI